MDRIERRDDSLNSLTPFDMCVALSQAAINAQLRSVWLEVCRKEAPDDVDPARPTKDFTWYRMNTRTQRPSRDHVRATLAAPVMSTVITGGTTHQVKLILTVDEANLSYYDVDAEAVVEQTGFDLKHEVIVNLDRTRVDRDKILAVLGAQTEAAVHDAIARSGLPPEVFSIEYLFLELGSNTLMQSTFTAANDAARALVGTTLATYLQSLWASFLPANFGAGMPLGTVVRPRRGAAPTLAVTDMAHYVHRNPAEPGAATLDYLCLVEGSTHTGMPTDVAAAAAAMREPWIALKRLNGELGSIHGVQTLSHEVFLPYLRGRLRQIFHPVYQGFGGYTEKLLDDKRWEYTDSPDPEEQCWNVPDNGAPLYRVVQIKSHRLVVTMAPQRGTNEIAIDVEVTVNVKVRTEDIFGRSHVYYADRTGEAVGRGWLRLGVDGIGSDAAIVCHTAVEFADPSYGGSTDMGKLEDFLRGLFGQKTIEAIVTEIVASQVASMRRLIVSDIAAIQYDFKGHRFIPAGQGVFSFSNVRFAFSTWDLAMDLAYDTTPVGV
jgi:hypothetical protein